MGDDADHRDRHRKTRVASSKVSALRVASVVWSSARCGAASLLRVQGAFEGDEELVLEDGDLGIGREGHTRPDVKLI
jgi:hypothetical protein